MEKFIPILLFAICKLPPVLVQRQCPVGQEDVCDTNCNRRCSDRINGPTQCPRVTCVTTSCLCDPKQGYWLDENTGRCVPGRYCSSPQPGYSTPTRTCPRGQTPGCGNNCGRTCEDYITYIQYRSQAPKCPRYACNPNTLTCQCDPNQGFYYSTNRNMCVSAQQCVYDAQRGCSTCGGK